MVKSFVSVLFVACNSMLIGQNGAAAFSLSMNGGSNEAVSDATLSNRRSFLSTSIATVAAASLAQPSFAAPEIYNTESGIKYAITKQPTAKKPVAPLQGDIVGVEYTGYLTNGQIFDATHAEGKTNALLFKLGSGSVIPGLDDMVSRMVVGQKVQAIIPPGLAYGEKGVCLDDGECLIKPGSTLVYDIFLKRSSIPPP